MDAKDSKVPIYIAILVAVILIAAGGYFALGGPAKLSKEKPAVTPAETPAKTAAPGEAPVVAAPVKVETIKCELCHKDSQTLKPHVDGGKLCVNCHGSQVHSIHIGKGTIDMKCDSCHGPPQKITVPKVEKGEGPGHFSTCEQCHAPPPDSLKPSNGELVMIHLSRGTYCTNCHGTDISAIHAAALANASRK